MCRDLLERAMDDRLVRTLYGPGAGSGPAPQALTAGQLTGVANLLAAFLREGRERPPEREAGQKEVLVQLARDCERGDEAALAALADLITECGHEERLVLLRDWSARARASGERVGGRPETKSGFPGRRSGSPSKPNRGVIERLNEMLERLQAERPGAERAGPGGGDS